MEHRSSERALLEIVVAVVIVIAAGVLLLGIVSFFAGLIGTLVKIALFVFIVYLVIRVMSSRRR